MSKKIICKLCDLEFDYQSGYFSNHLKEKHGISREQYVVQTEHGGVHPKCQCGFCNDNARFFNRKNVFYKINSEHKNFEWIKQKHIEKNGIPICNGCKKNPVEFYRGKPNSYCCHECQPSNWNQDKVRKTVFDKYGVNNVMEIKEVKNKVLVASRKSWKNDKELNIKKAKSTKLERYGNENYVNQDLMKKTFLKNYGVEHISQTEKFKKDTSRRMVNKNPMKNADTVLKCKATFMKKMENGEIKFFNTKKFKNYDLYYQGKNEYNFLEYCENINILSLIKRAKSFKYLKEDFYFGIRHLPDFMFSDKYIVEIKSTYIMNLQGGNEKVLAKKRSVEKEGYKYILVLDNDFSEFNKNCLV